MQKQLITFNRKWFSYSKQIQLADIFQIKKVQLQQVRQIHGTKSKQNLIVNDCFDGMKNIYALLHENSFVDNKLGVMFKGYSLQEVKEFLIRGQQHNNQETDEPLPEALFHLFLTGKFPKAEEFSYLQQELHQRSQKNIVQIKEFIDSLPSNMTLLTQLSSTILYLQKDSKFAKAYSEGLNKNKYWEVCLEDSLDLLSQMPYICAQIYNKTYSGKCLDVNPRADQDWTSSFLSMINMDSEGIEADGLRAYLMVMSDYGGSVNQHTMSLVGSALADVYLSYSSALNALQGPYHQVISNQFNVFIQEIQAKYGARPSDEEILEQVQIWLKQEQSIPGFGHEYINYTDPRLMHLKQFTDKNLQSNQNLFIAKRLFRIIPYELQKLTGKDQKGNVFAYSSVFLQEIGFKDIQSHNLLLALSRSIGCTSQIVIERALGMPIERPGSCDSTYIINKFKNKSK